MILLVGTMVKIHPSLGSDLRKPFVEPDSGLAPTLFGG